MHVYYKASLVKEVMESESISVFFDKDLVYRIVNYEACKALNKNSEDLIGKNIIDLFPGIIASSNHRNLLKAQSGQLIKDAVIASGNGQLYNCTYKPVFDGGNMLGILVHANSNSAKRT